jgi:hypothetical protein
VVQPIDIFSKYLWVEPLKNKEKIFHLIVFLDATNNKDVCELLVEGSHLETAA